uniref:Methyltransferase type 11 domain-containing protein n=1 Tax=Ananas comosus var. bracteatus TaxID=296719 RepID=A0A6V7PYY2_ANACO|nr:unnamed protein product [Ananas comosus var. bracteatus]
MGDAGLGGGAASRLRAVLLPTMTMATATASSVVALPVVRQSRHAASLSAAVFSPLRAFCLLSNSSPVLCVSAGAGQLVAALRDSGVADVTGVDLLDSPRSSAAPTPQSPLLRRRLRPRLHPWPRRRDLPYEVYRRDGAHLAAGRRHCVCSQVVAFVLV